MNKTLYILITILFLCKSHEEIVTECLTTEGTKGFCINIYNCASNATLLHRRCGPRNENKRKPKVCCNPKDIEILESKSTKSAACGIQNNSPILSRIVGGEETSLGEFPWLARIIRKNTENDLIFSCTASLITSQVVLTVAHCLIAPELEELGTLYAVTLGEHETECGLNNNKCSNYKNFALLSKVIPHPRFRIDDRNRDNDIGLIILRKRMETAFFIVPICLLQESYEANQYFVSGWGKTEEGLLSSTKLKTSLPPFSWQQCVEKYSTIGVRVSRRQLCAGGLKNQDSCKGDSGGPLMVSKNGKWYAAGLVSFGIGCGREGWPGVYTYIPSHVEWIKTNLP